MYVPPTNQWYHFPFILIYHARVCNPGRVAGDEVYPDASFHYEVDVFIPTRHIEIEYSGKLLHLL